MFLEKEKYLRVSSQMQKIFDELAKMDEEIIKRSLKFDFNELKEEF